MAPTMLVVDRFSPEEVGKLGCSGDWKLFDVDRFNPDDEMLGMLPNDDGNDDCSDDWKLLKPPPMPASPPPSEPIW